MTQLLDIAACMALCYIAWGFFFFRIHRFGIDFTERWWWTALYFFGVGIGMAFLFLPYIAGITKHFVPLPFIVLGVVLVVQLVIDLYLPRVLREPTDYFLRHPNRSFLKLNWRRLISKSMDIAAQQVFVVLLVIFLQNAGLALYQIILAFAALFMSLHIPLLASEWGRWPAYLFASAVIAFSILFPPLILFVPYGFVYNIALHWTFYTATAVFFWLQYNLRERETAIHR